MTDLNRRFSAPGFFGAAVYAVKRCLLILVFMLFFIILYNIVSGMPGARQAGGLKI